MAHTTIVAPLLSEQTKTQIDKLIDLNLHMSNLLTLLEKNIEDDGLTLIHSARRYCNDEFYILKKLLGDEV